LVQLSSRPALPARGQAATKIRVTTGGVEEFALPFYALQKGFFRAAGLDVELQMRVGGDIITQALAAGAIDLAVTNSGSMTSAHVRGSPLYRAMQHVLTCAARGSRHRAEKLPIKDANFFEIP
jgi:ABC-type nitrate/sulfonate/bicarbonate transport system substrate-binding protein